VFPLLVAGLVAGCFGDSGTLVVLNRTTVPVVLEQFGYPVSTLVVDACSERRIAWNNVWGGTGTSGDWPHDTVPAGAFAMPLPGDWLHMPMEQGTVSATLLLTPDGIGVSQQNFPPSEATSGGSFPPDPGADGCAGVPPPLPPASPPA
jgi:hypothetical protein